MFTNFFKSIGRYLNIQIEWLKSFFSESDGKGSNKRLLSGAVVGMFIMAYYHVAVFSNQIVDIPLYWAIMIASIIGLNVIDYFVKGYINKSINSDNINAGKSSISPDVKP
jgi:hypothetical protein